MPAGSTSAPAPSLPSSLPHHLCLYRGNVADRGRPAMEGCLGGCGGPGLQRLLLDIIGPVLTCGVAGGDLRDRVPPGIRLDAFRPGRRAHQATAALHHGGVWDVLLVGGVVYVRFLRGRVGWPRSRTPSGTHGTARWGDGRGLLRVDTGRLVGRLGGRLLRYAGDGHLLTIGPTRSGKGVSAVIPNLLTHRGSVVVTDLKKGRPTPSPWRTGRQIWGSGW